MPGGARRCNPLNTNHLRLFVFFCKKSLVRPYKKKYDEGVMNIPYILTDNSLTAILNGMPYTIQNSHENWNTIIDAIKNDSVTEDELLDLIDTATAVTNWSEGKVEVENGHVYFNGEVVHGTIVDKILSFIKDGISPTPLVRFLENLMLNPSRRSVSELYSFLEHGNMPITPDGHFLGYKSVRSDWKDHHTGKFDNSVGQVLEMTRNSVCDDANLGCSYGFHVGSLEYATNFGGSDRKVVIVKVNPADVVSVPHDCDFQKMRTSRYEVVGVYDAPLPNGYYDGYDEGDDDDYYDEDEDYNSYDAYGRKPNGDRYHNVRDNKGRFVPRKS